MDLLTSPVYDLRTFATILQHGKLYFPAWKHYEDPAVRVVCDRCKRNDFPACIGYEQLDLCLQCADAVARVCPAMPDSLGAPQMPRRIDPRVHENAPVLTLMVQDIFRPPATRMMDSMYRPR